MKKWQKKINRRVSHYDRGLDAHVAKCRRLGFPMMCDRVDRHEGFRDGAEWMLNEFVHMMRQKKYKCDKLIRESATMEEKSVPLFAAAIYSHIIKELTK